MKFEDGVTTFVEHFLERETPPSVLFGFWDEVQGGVDFDQAGVPFADADAVIVPKTLTDDLEVTVEIDGEEKTVKVKNGLKDRERVVVVRSLDGQRYLVIGRL